MKKFSNLLKKFASDMLAALAVKGIAPITDKTSASERMMLKILFIVGSPFH